MRERLDVWADAETSDALIARFGYAFVQPEGSLYPPILNLHRIDGDVTIDGPGGEITFRPFEVEHGRIDSLGFRIGDVAYLPDVSEFRDRTWEALKGLDCMILDCLRRSEHPSHFHLEKTLETLDRLSPKRAVLTNMHIDLDYETLIAETADRIVPAYDGLVIEANS